MRKLVPKIIFLLIIIAIVSFTFSWQVRDFIYQVIYDYTNNNTEINSKSEVKLVIDSFDDIGLDGLDQEYRIKSKINDPSYLKMHMNARYFIIDPRDIYKRVVGNIRIKDLLSRDEFYHASIMNRSKKIYWRINVKLLYRIIELRNELRKKGYFENGFEINHGYRTPQHNLDVGGASKSRHIKGEAVDMIIKDINRDGMYTNEDKEIVIDILERKVIKNDGGIGKYPGTRVVHMDVRGYRARWDSY